jgi:hypothetical protein
MRSRGPTGHASDIQAVGAAITAMLRAPRSPVPDLAPTGLFGWTAAHSRRPRKIIGGNWPLRMRKVELSYWYTSQPFAPKPYFLPFTN